MFHPWLRSLDLCLFVQWICIVLTRWQLIGQPRSNSWQCFFSLHDLILTHCLRPLSALSMEGKVCPPARHKAPTISRWLFETECRRFQQMASNYLKYAKVLKGVFVSSNLRGSCTWHDVSGMCINVLMSAFIPSTLSAMSFITDNCLWYEWNFLSIVVINL